MAKDKVREYEGDGIVVTYEVARCIHAKECVHGLPAVFDPERRPWVDPRAAATDRVVEVVERCPTGALRYRHTDRDGGSAVEAAAATNSVEVTADGPLYLRGDLRLALADGGERQETRLALCRCGQSRNKPYCDNSHREAGFRDGGALGTSALEAGEGGGGDGPLTLSPSPGGPLRLAGPFTLRGGASGEGGAHHGAGTALCRCGGSANKPFCDGSHKRIGFTGE